MSNSVLATPSFYSSHHKTLDMLKSSRGRAVGIIDPFKIDTQTVVDKAKFAQDNGEPWVILASTDKPNHKMVIDSALRHIKRETRLPIILHFSATPGEGFPIASEADGVIWPALLGSSSPYHVWHSYLDTAYTIGCQSNKNARYPDPILTAALTVGTDNRTGRLLGTVPLIETNSEIDYYARIISTMNFDMLYLYSRNEFVSPETCRRFRELLPDDCLIFVSGNMDCSEKVVTYLSAGADYVGFSSAWECAEWKYRALDMFRTQS